MCSALHSSCCPFRKALLVAVEGSLFPLPVSGPMGEDERFQRQAENHVSSRFSSISCHHYRGALYVWSSIPYHSQIPSLYRTGVQAHQVSHTYHEIPFTILFYENIAYCNDKLGHPPFFIHSHFVLPAGVGKSGFDASSRYSLPLHSGMLVMVF